MRRAAMAAAVLVAAAGAGWADQAHVRAGAEEGQAILFTMRGNCFGVTPAHVMAAGGDFASLVRRDPTLVTGAAVVIRDLGDDLVMFGASGGIEAACGEPFARGADVATLVQEAGGRVRMRHVFEDGTTVFRDAEVVALDTSRLGLREAGDWTIGPSDSGSAVMVGEALVGIVQAQGGPGEPATALRWDFATHLLVWEAERGAAPAAEPAAAAPGLAGVSVERTSARPLESGGTGEVLAAPLEAPGEWRATAVEWPVEIVLAMPGGAVADVRGLVFHAVPGAAEQHPRTVEIQRTRSADGDRGWSSYATAVLNPGEAADRVDFPGGMQARRLRVLIHDTWGDRAEIALRRIEVITGE